MRVGACRVALVVAHHASDAHAIVACDRADRAISREVSQVRIADDRLSAHALLVPRAARLWVAGECRLVAQRAARAGAAIRRPISQIGLTSLGLREVTALLTRRHAGWRDASRFRAVTQRSRGAGRHQIPAGALRVADLEHGKVRWVAAALSRGTRRRMTDVLIAVIFTFAQPRSGTLDRSDGLTIGGARVELRGVEITPNGARVAAIAALVGCVTECPAGLAL